jgi:hypothetical protein
MSDDSGVLVETVLLDEVVVLLGCRRLVLAPAVAVVVDEATVVDPGLGVLERPLVQGDCHRLTSSSSNSGASSRR